jgi:death-on-curing protein
MRYLSLAEVTELHRLVIDAAGGVRGIRDMGALDAAVAQPRMSFGGEDLYPTLAEKAAALCFSLVQNHPFLDGNKRVGHAAMETFLVLNGLEIQAPSEEQEQVMLRVASGEMRRADLVHWLEAYSTPRHDR